MAPTIPKQHYVTIKYSKDSSTESGLLGFSSPYTKDAAFKNRKSTQDRWAYGYSCTVNIDEDDEITISNNENTTGKFTLDSMTLFTTKCYPLILDNIPLAGFEVAKSVRRSSWNTGNVVWRIADPRGFELEISSANFARVLDCTTIINGVIQGQCLWGRDAANNLLLPVASDIYQTALSLTAKTNTKIALKDINPGDTVAVLSKNVSEEDAICEYLGKYYFLEAKHENFDHYGYATRSIELTHYQVERYLFRSVKNDTYFILSSPKVVNIINKVETQLDKLEIAKTITAKLSYNFTISDTTNLILISPTKIVFSELTTTLDPIAESFSEWPIVDRYYAASLVAVDNLGNQFLAKRSDGTHNSSGSYDYFNEAIKIVDINLITGVVKLATEESLQKWKGSRATIKNSTIRIDNLNDYQLFKFTVSTKSGIVGTILRTSSTHY